MKELLEMNKPFKKYLPIYMIMLSIVLLMGTSYALLRSSHQGTNTYTMNVGTLAVTFVDSETNALTLENAYPMTDDEGMSETKELTFTVKNTGTVTAKYSVYIEETSTTPEFKSVIRFISNKNNTGYNSPKTLASDNYIDKDSYLETSKTATYKVKAWMADAADSTYMNKTFTARVVVTGEQTSINPEYIRNVIKSKQTSTCKTYVDEDGITYVSGSSECIDFNYVWYSGKMWRITAVNSDGTMKMITDDNMTTISYGSNATFANSYIYQWLNEDFLDTLYNYQNIIVEDSTWNVTSTTSESTKLPETTLVNNSTIGVSTPVGLLNSYEYYMSYKNTNSNLGFLANGVYFWLLNQNSSNVWMVDNVNGTMSSTASSSFSVVRPVINLNSNIKISSGTGTKSNPYRISGDNITTDSELLNTRISGEYVLLNDELYRIVGIEEEKTKINKVDVISSDESGIENKFVSATTYGSSTSDEYWDHYLNNTWIANLPEKEILEVGTYYLGIISSSSRNYKETICSTNDMSSPTKTCTKTSEVWQGYIGLPRYGEMFASPQAKTTSNVWMISTHGALPIVMMSNGGLHPSQGAMLLPVRPSMFLSSYVSIAGGTGLPDDPFIIG